jgi:hypothetical protein
MAVILGLAIWNLIVAVMDYVVVPWLGDLFGPGSTLPVSFTQRPYDYPDLFVSVVEFCIAAIVAISINWYFQRPGRPGRVKVVKTSSVVSQNAAVPEVVSPQPTAPAAMAPPATSPAPPVVPAQTPLPAARAAAAPTPAAAKPAPAPPPKPQTAKPQPPKEVYYNIVGEPLPPDED